MKSYTTERFRKALANLPPHVQRPRTAYLRFREDPAHPSLQFKQVYAGHSIYSVRVSLGYRALAVRDGGDLVWFWIGSHADYDQLLQRS